MLRRLILGMVVGLLVGAALAFGLIRLTETTGLGGIMSAIAAFGAAAVAGALTGILAGKPIWAEGAKVEAGLKAFFGAVLGVGALFVLQRWGGDISTPQWLGGTAPIGDLPGVSLPLIAGGLGALFGLDNVPDAPSSPGAPGVRKRVAGAGHASAVGAAGPDEADDDTSDVDPRRARR
jgi:hypothetical protein